MNKINYVPVSLIIIVHTLFIYMGVLNYKTVTENVISLQNQGNQDNKADSKDAIPPRLNYKMEEHEVGIKSLAINIDIRYPQISYCIDSNLDSEKIKRINRFLTPSDEIQSYYSMITDGLIKISDTDGLTYESPPHSYELGNTYTYTMGLANDYFLNLYERSISYTRNSHWRYGAILIDVQDGERIAAEEFFDVRAFRKYIKNGDFKANKEDFDIQSYFKDVGNAELSGYLYDAFINQNEQVEVIVVYGEGPETVMYADLNQVMGMIKPQYLDYFK